MFDVFTRTWWKRNPRYPNGREPCAGRKTYLARNVTESEARRICRSYNESHAPGPLSRKAEYQER